MVPSSERLGLRERKKLETRSAIRAAAFELFEREGFDAVGIERIAAAADVSRSTFFNYFPTKEAVAFDVDPATAAGWQEILAGRPLQEPLWEALEHVLVAYLETFGDHVVLMHKLKAGSPALRASSRDGFDRFWGEIVAWAGTRTQTQDPVTTTLTLNTAQAVFRTALELWDADAGAQQCIALLRRGFATAGAGFAAATPDS